MEDKVIKCTQCGANLPKNGNVCEYCGAEYKTAKHDEDNVPEVFGKGDIISKIEKIGGMFDMFDDLF